MSISRNKIFLLISIYLSLRPWPSLETTIIGGICVSQKHLVFYRHPISSMVFGTNALFVKPAISLSPMLAVAVLNRYGYTHVQRFKGITPHPSTTSAIPSGSQLEELKGAMFFLVCWYPIILGTIQFISWSFFKITNRTEKEIQVKG